MPVSSRIGGRCSRPSKSPDRQGDRLQSTMITQGGQVHGGGCLKEGADALILKEDHKEKEAWGMKQGEKGGPAAS